MFELDIEMLKEQGLQLMDSAKKTAQDLADKGKNKLDLLNQQARLSRHSASWARWSTACIRPARRILLWLRSISTLLPRSRRPLRTSRPI